MTIASRALRPYSMGNDSLWRYFDSSPRLGIGLCRRLRSEAISAPQLSAPCTRRVLWATTEQGTHRLESGSRLLFFQIHQTQRPMSLAKPSSRSQIAIVIYHYTCGPPMELVVTYFISPDTPAPRYLRDQGQD